MASETNNGKEGGLLKGKRHEDKNGKSLGGIKAIVTDTNQIVELEGGEVIINREASKKHWKELSKINQSAGGGVPILPPDSVESDTEEYKNGGRTIDFNPNHIPNKWVYDYAKNIKEKYPKVWGLGGNEFGNEAFKNLERVINRGSWTENEEWMYVKWQSFNARHKGDFRIAGVIANLKWLNKVSKGWDYMKSIIQKEIEKKYPKKGWKHKNTDISFKDGGSVKETENGCEIDLIVTQKFKVDGEIQNKEIYSDKTENCFLQLLYSTENKNLFQIAGLFVKNSFRKNGLGSSLIIFSKNRAIELGFDKIVYYIADYDGEEYNNLVSFCKRNGFEFVGSSTKKMVLKISKNKFKTDVEPAKGINLGGVSTKETCIEYINSHKAILNNGYYLIIKDSSIYVGDNDEKVPHIKSFCLVADTINAIELSNNLQKLIGGEKSVSQIIIREFIQNAKRLNNADLDEIASGNIIIADRDNIVCSAIEEKYKQGGFLEPHKEVKTDLGTVLNELNYGEYEQTVYLRLRNLSDEKMLDEIALISDDYQERADAIQLKIDNYESEQYDIDTEIDEVNDSDLSKSKKATKEKELQKKYESIKDKIDLLEIRKKEQETLKDKFYILDANDDYVKEVIQKVDARLQTRKQVNLGYDLFPEESNIAELVKVNEPEEQKPTHKEFLVKYYINTGKKHNVKTWICAQNRNEAIDIAKKDDDRYTELISCKPTGNTSWSSSCNKEDAEFDENDEGADEEKYFDSNYKPIFWHLTQSEFCEYAENYEIDTRLDKTKARLECKDFYKYAVILPLLADTSERNVFLLAVETGLLPYEKVEEIINSVGAWKDSNRFVKELMEHDRIKKYKSSLWLIPKELYLSSDYYKNNFTKKEANKFYARQIYKYAIEDDKQLHEFLEKGIVKLKNIEDRLKESEANITTADERFVDKLRGYAKKFSSKNKLKALSLLLNEDLPITKEFKTHEDMAKDMRTYTDAFQPDVERRIAQAKKENEEIQKEELKELSQNEYDFFINAIKRVPNINLKRTIEIAEKIAKLAKGKRKEHLEYFAEATQYTVSEAEGEPLDIFYLDDLNSIVGLSGTDFSAMSRKIEIGIFNKEKTELLSQEVKKYKIAKDSFKKMDNKKQALLKNSISKFPIDYQRDHIAIKKALNDVSNFINKYKDSKLPDFIIEAYNITSKWEIKEIEKDDEEKELKRKKSLFPENERDFISKIIKDTYANVKYNKIKLEKLAKEHGIKEQNLAKELAELSISFVARVYAHDTELKAKERYEKIVKLYENQVNLSHRTSESIMLQQYSTPAPIGYLAGLFCGFDKDTGNYFEPSAGNGLLTIAGNVKNFTVNEIDTVRNRNLSALGFKEVLKQDASLPFKELEHKFDAVITNPPFGKTEVVTYGKSDIKSLEQVMSLRALDTMKDNGRCAIIIGGHTEYDKEGRIQAGKNRTYFVYLYKHYNVMDVINISGRHLYSRQGTSFNTRLILIDGRKETPSGFPPLIENPIPMYDQNSPVPVDTFGVLWSRVNKSI